MYKGKNLLLEQVNLTETCELRAAGRQLGFLSLLQGKCKYLNAQVSHILGPGDLLLFSRSVAGTLNPLDKKNASTLGFLVGLDQIGSLLGLSEVCLLDTVSVRLHGSRYYPSAHPLARQCQELLASTPPGPSLEHRSHLLRIAATVLSEEFKQVREQPAHPAGANGDFASVLSRLSLDDVQKLSVDDLAKKLGYSRRHLNRLFREHLGTSVSDLKMELRLLKSLFLLQNSAAKVIDVALACGFNHLGLFSQCFKRRFLVSPNQWRRQELARGGGKNPAGLFKHDCQLLSSGMCLWTNLQQGAGAKNNGHGSCGQPAI